MKNFSKFLVAGAFAGLMLFATTCISFAAVSADQPIEITKAEVKQNGTNYDVTVNYDVFEGFGEQITVLATTEEEVKMEQVEGTDVYNLTNVLYIDQMAQTAEKTFTFSYDATKGDVVYVKVGGTGINTPYQVKGIIVGDETIVFGDVNGDGQVNTTDASLVLKKFAGTLDKFPAGDDKVGDVNGDTNVNTTDASLILKKFAGTLDKFPVEE